MLETESRWHDCAAQNACRFVPVENVLDFSLVPRQGALELDLALRLDVLAVCAVFAFVGAILLGAF
jgi:hypothetical protein